jgi:hypothetical protein
MFSVSLKATYAPLDFLFANCYQCSTSLSGPKVIRWWEIWTVCWVEEIWNFTFWIISMVAAPVWGQALSWCKTTSFSRIPLCLLQIAGCNSSSSVAQYPYTIVCLYMILVVLKDDPVKVPKQCKHHFASRRHT